MEAVNRLSKINPGDKAGTFDTDQWLKKCYAAMDDDFNSPLLIAQLFEAVKFINLVIHKDHPIDQVPVGNPYPNVVGFYSRGIGHCP